MILADNRNVGYPDNWVYLIKAISIRAELKALDTTGAGLMRMNEKSNKAREKMVSKIRENKSKLELWVVRSFDEYGNRVKRPSEEVNAARIMYRQMCAEENRLTSACADYCVQLVSVERAEGDV